MTPPVLEFPALYKSANKGSATAQRFFLWTIKGEYCLLLCVSATTASRDWTGYTLAFTTLLLFLLVGLFVFKVVKKLDQTWYRCRALAESIKTSSWRFTMRAHPFEDADNIEVPKANFRNLLHDILKTNRHIAESLHDGTAEQVTRSMIEVRNLPLDDRVKYYVKNRIDDQRVWYSKKSVYNRKALHFWIGVTVVVYVLAGISLHSKALGIGSASLAFGPLVVLITSVLGWLQMKRHSELIASYNLTAHEIGIIRGKSSLVKSEIDFSDFVNEAELAFSREHTQWVARRDVN